MLSLRWLRHWWPLADANMDDVLDSIKQQGTHMMANSYAFGFSESNVGIYYNKKMFMKRHWRFRTSNTSKTWPGTNLKAISKKLTDHFKQPAIDFRLNSMDEMPPYLYAITLVKWWDCCEWRRDQGVKVTSTVRKVLRPFNSISRFKEGYATISPVEKGFGNGAFLPMVFVLSLDYQRLKREL